MALWKPFRGSRADLESVEKHDGYVYFCTDDGSLFFDYMDSEGNLQRKQISADSELPSIDNDTFHPEDYSLPILYLDGDTSSMTKENAVDLSYRWKDLEGTATVKWQGNSSLQYPKKNYTVKFDTEFEAKEGWGEQKKYCMKANWIDFSHSRNIIAATIWGECVKRYEHYVYTNFPLKNLPNAGAIDGFPIAMVINGEYVGLYSFNIPKEAWLFGLDENNTNHCVIGASGVSDTMCGFKEMPLIDDEFGFEYEHISDNATDADKTKFQTSIQNLYTALKNCSSRTDLMNNVGQYLDIQKAVVYMIYCAHLGNYDGLTKNYLLVTTNGQKWHMSAYDLDATFGNEPYGKFYYYAGQYTYERLSTYNMIFKRIYEYAPDLLYSWTVKLYALEPYAINDKIYNYAVNIPKIYFDEEIKLWKEIPGTNTNSSAQMTSFITFERQKLDEELKSLVLNKKNATLTKNENNGITANITSIGIIEEINNIWGGQTANI